MGIIDLYITCLKEGYFKNPMRVNMQNTQYSNWHSMVCLLCVYFCFSFWIPSIQHNALHNEGKQQMFVEFSWLKIGFNCKTFGKKNEIHTFFSFRFYTSCQKTSLLHLLNQCIIHFYYASYKGLETQMNKFSAPFPWGSWSGGEGKHPGK